MKKINRTIMGNFRNYVGILAVLLLCAGCQDDDSTFGAIVAPSNIVITTEIVGVDADNPNGDGSGQVIFKATADQALGYSFAYGDGTDGVVPSGETVHRYSVVGLNTYTVVVNALGAGGLSSSATLDVEVFSSFDDLEAKQLLSGGEVSSKTWYPKLDENGHLGVGPTLAQDIGDDGTLNGHWFPQYDSTDAFGKCAAADSDCFCDLSLTFELDATGNLTFNQNNNGSTFFNWAHGAVVGQQLDEFADACFEFDTMAESAVTLVPSSTDWSQVADPEFPVPRGTVMNFTNDGFMGYYTGVSSYEILQIDSNYLYVRFFDNVNPDLAWYQMFTTTPATSDFTSTFNDLVWSDEFDTDGAPDPANWTYDIGTGSNGWGNGEAQVYTNDAENVTIENGILRIIAKANGDGYTSARLKTQNLYEFTYGRVEIRAKLPAAQGTWPALWSLGADIEVNPWPGCGEIDIIEQTGQDKNTVLATIHHPAVSPGAGDTGTKALPTATTTFHNYSLDWTAETITFLIDDEVFRSIPNTPDLPFKSDFFLIMNVAMGGSLGGVIDPAFTEDQMEVDYVRVYQ
ncbi:glycoside hydrolase family 16 protein [Subsaximicrobium wynnwilliamsii]|nr:glycoside hydrolase family 16 protein [Subsaximicrobium wynnwilliamsii]